jgi:competence protein ComEC
VGAVLLSWVLGTAAQLLQAQLWPWPVYAGWVVAGGAALAVLLKRQWPTRADLGVVALCVAGMAFGLTGWRAAIKPALGSGLPEGQVVWVQGEVQFGVRDFGLGQRFEFAMSAWRHGEGAWQAREGRLRLSWYRMPEGVRLAAGQSWTLPVRLRAPHGHRNPGGTDVELRYWRDGVWATGSVVSKPPLSTPQRMPTKDGWGVSRIRQATLERLNAAGLDSRWTPWLAAVVLGDQGELSVQDWALLRDTGTAHLVSISGLHVTVLAGWAYGLMGWLWRAVLVWRPAWGARGSRAQWSAGAAIVAALVYAVFAGWGVPVQRAALMLITAGVLRTRARAWPAYTMWLWVATVVLVWDPWAFLQAGFWLSFVAVGILFLRPRTARPGWHWRELLGAQAMMTVALAPMSAWWFGQVSVVGLVANLVAIPWVSVVVLPLALLGTAFTPAWALAAWTVSLMVPVLTWFQSWPGAIWSLPPVPAHWALLAVVGLGLAFLPWSWAVRLVAVWLAVPALLWRPAQPPMGAFWVDALDVGQGSAVLVRTAGHALLFDAGPSYFSGGSAGRSIIVPSLQALGVSLDRVVLSHQDHDHIGGAPDVLQSQAGVPVLASFTPRFAPAAQRCVAGQSWLWDGVRFDVVHPLTAGKAHAPLRAGNAQSCVLRVSNTDGSVLLTGDLEKEQEAELLAQPVDWRVSLLVAAHHGSATSSSRPWLEAVQPAWVWVQAGYRNPYGHPAASVVARWAQMGLPVHNTATCGALSWRSEAPGISACERTTRVRYWAHRSMQGVR